jgi:hypothetical protein
VTIDDERDSRPPEPTLFEKRPGGPRKRPGSRIPVGVYLGVALAVIVIVGVVLFMAASHAGTGGNGQTTSGLVLVLPTLLR